jgi:hypothetical protein
MVTATKVRCPRFLSDVQVHDGQRLSRSCRSRMTRTGRPVSRSSLPLRKEASGRLSVCPHGTGNPPEGSIEAVLRATL